MKQIDKIIEKLINNKFIEFKDIKPKIKKESKAVKYYSKILNTKIIPKKEDVFSYTYIKKYKDFNKILRITIDSNGKIIKISYNK